ncbi:hypothetical protein [Streptomyces longispororuber]|uniref:hypothetical protein n=1 Tax=Streptomyces longispororuber TaxID=68230 RepID=UPI00210D75E0|nr:hypothetical protein [Streptomyces longispororuber]MCQ4213389.1 hypothetical protein [Streptomyces longispororuber]
MTKLQAEIVNFLRGNYAEELRRAQEIGSALTTMAGQMLDIPKDAATAQARSSVHAADNRARFLEETVVAYLGTAGPTGQIADQQLRLLACEFMHSRDFQPAWMP